MEWTSSQTKAIEDRGHTLLVSAGAGAGKTSCLTERIVRRLAMRGQSGENETGYDISEILVVTFTKAAAADIKEKLYRNLANRLSEEPENKGLFSQLMGVGNARISTIHSFCLDLIKDNFQKLDVSPSVRVLDDAQGEQIRTKIVKRLLDDLYEKDDEKFLGFVECFSSLKGDSELETMILEIYDKLRSFPDPFSWLEGMIEALEADVDFDELFDSNLGKRLRKVTKKYLSEILTFIDEAKEISESAGNMACFKHFASHLEACERLENAEKYDEARSCFKYDKVNMYTKGLEEDEKNRLRELQENVKKRIEKLGELYGNDSETVRAEMKKTVSMMKTVLSIESEFDKRYTERKRELGVLDYSDLEHYTLVLLKNDDGSDSDICISMRESLKEIYIDEYQDVNPLQDEIFSRIRRDDNCFMVGDVKQSIYRFRNAEPSIFMGYDDSFPLVEDAEKEGKLYLSENFRSSKNIIDYVNTIFRAVYTKENGASGYGDAEALVFGGTENSDLPVYTVECESLSEEAEYTAREILKAVASGEYGWNDFALLLRSVKGPSKEFIDTFKKYGIPYVIEQSGDFFTRPEVLLAMSLLRVIDNPMDDISLASTMMSPVFGFSAEELFDIRKISRKRELYRCVQSCAYVRDRTKKYKVIKEETKRSIPCIRQIGQYIMREANVPLELKGKCKTVIESLRSWRTLSENISTDSLVWYLYTATSIYSGVETADGRNNLILLYEYARSFEGSAFKGLSAFVEYYNDVESGNAKLSEATSDAGDGVRIMSIHKSKGLDFPAVFVADLGKRPNTQDMNKKYLISRKNGLSFRLRNSDERKKEDTLLRRLDEIDEKNELFVEEMRLLYVALTRAKKRLYVLGNKKYNGSMFSLLSTAITDSPECRVFEYIEESIDANEIVASETKTLDITVDELKKRLEYKYPHKGTLRKVSVSELKLDDRGVYEPTVNRSIIMERPSFATSYSGGAQRGTAMHEFMQFCDFQNVVMYGALEEAKRLCTAKMLTDEQLELLNTKKLESFFKSKLYSEITASPRVYREKRFSINESAELIGETESESVLVQGVIDMFFENPDGTYTVVDYKTDYVGGDNEEILIEHHRSQLGYYVRAVEKMTGGTVSRAVIYSFSLEREITLPEI